MVEHDREELLIQALQENVDLRRRNIELEQENVALHQRFGSIRLRNAIAREVRREKWPYIETKGH